LLESAIAAEPARSAYRLLLAQAYDCANRPDDAETTLRALLAREPRHVEAALALARRLDQRKDSAAVIEILRPVAPHTKEYEVHHLLGAALFQTGAFDEARRSLTQATQTDPSHPQDFVLLGDLHQAQERFALAADAYEQALRGGLDEAELHFKLGTAYFRLRNTLGQTTRRTVSDGRPGTLCNAGYLLDPATGNPPKFEIAPPNSAVYQAYRARELGLRTWELDLLIADIWREARRFDRAVTEYQAVDQRVPPTHRATYCARYADALLGTGDRDGYLTRLREAADLDRAAYAPLIEPAYLRVVELYNQDGDAVKYLAFLESAVERLPGSSALHELLGQAFWEHGRPGDAARQWRITLELRPDHPDRARLLELIQKATEKS
jgi:tetratricopeptide (TPR) repeat protein